MGIRSIHGTLSKELLNNALKYHKKDIDIILKEYPDGLIPTGQKKAGKIVKDYYYNVYTWISESEYKEWREASVKRVQEEGYNKEAFDWWECLNGLREDYLPFRKKEGQLL